MRYLLAVWTFIKLLVTRLWDVLWGEKTPLLVTVGLTVAAAYLSPMITERFERQKMRSEYVLSNLQEMNSLIADLYVQVTAINYAVAGKYPAPKENVEKSREIIARLHWKLIETAAMMSDRRDIETLKKFQSEVTDVSTALNGRLDLNGCEALLREVNEMAFQGALVIQAIGRRVDLGDAPNSNSDSKADK